MHHPLIAPAELHELLTSDDPPVLLDVRWRLDVPDGRPAFREGHLPSAQYVSLDDELSAHGAPTDGRHPLPDPAAFQDTVRRWGVDDGDAVVVYDDWASVAAARAWWLLEDAGVHVRVLDGGLPAWRDAGLPLESGDGRTPDRGTATLHPGRLPRLTMDEAAALPQRGTLLDVRAAERYRGDVEPIDPRAGHIPGAVSLPASGSVDVHGRFLPEAQLRERFAHLDGDVIGVYCGSGVSASHSVLAMSLAGVPAALYPGSWSQWANHPDRVAVTGANP